MCRSPFIVSSIFTAYLASLSSALSCLDRSIHIYMNIPTKHTRTMTTTDMIAGKALLDAVDPEESALEEVEAGLFAAVGVCVPVGLMMVFVGTMEGARVVSLELSLLGSEVVECGEREGVTENSKVIEVLNQQGL